IRAASRLARRRGIPSGVPRRRKLRIACGDFLCFTFGFYGKVGEAPLISIRFYTIAPGIVNCMNDGGRGERTHVKTLLACVLYKRFLLKITIIKTSVLYSILAYCSKKGRFF
ncbi:MAG: hypothetical protein Q4E20_09825, partial [Eubacteriales bacterium]|nr:hypothetical protein [Eubacteriales bacterium]